MANSSNDKSNNVYRAFIMNKVADLLRELGEEVLVTKNNELAFPFVNDLKSDEWMRLTFSIPRGSTKDNAPYDGYELAEEHSKDVVEKAKKEAERQVKKEKDIAFDNEKRAIAKKKKSE